MTYRDDLGAVATAHLDELRGDLEQAMSALSTGRKNVDQLEHEVAWLQKLIALANPEAHSDGDAGDMTLHEAMASVLRTAPNQMLRATDLAAEINRQGLYRMRDGRPVEPQQIHARVGHYGHMFGKEGTFITLAKQSES